MMQTVDSCKDIGQTMDWISERSGITEFGLNIDYDLSM